MWHIIDNFLQGSWNIVTPEASWILSQLIAGGYYRSITNSFSFNIIFWPPPSQAFSERYLESYASNSAKYQAAAVNLADFPESTRKKTAIYYNPGNYLVPTTTSIITQFLEKKTTEEGYVDLSSFNIYDVPSVTDKDFVTDDVFVNIGEHVTTFLSNSPHAIF